MTERAKALRAPNWKPYAFFLASVVAIIVGLAAAGLEYERIRYREQAVSATRDLSLLLEGQLASTLDRIGLMLDGTFLWLAANEDKANKTGDPGRKIEAMLSRHSALVPEVHVLLAVDSTGRLIASTRQDPGQALETASGLLANDQGDSNRLLVSAPYFSSESMQWVILFARRQKTGGAAPTLIAAEVATEQLATPLNLITLGPQGAATIRQTDFTLVHRRAAGANVVGSRDVSQQLRDVITAAPAGGDYIAKTALDGVERSNSYRRVGEYPFYILVGLATSDYLAGWKEDRLTISLLASLAVLLAAGGTALAFRNARDLYTGLKLLETSHGALVNESSSREAAEAELRRSHSTLQLALASAEMAVWDLDVSNGGVQYDRRWLEILGRPDGSTTATLDEVLGSIHPDDVGMVTEALQAHIEGKATGYAAEFRIRRDDGQERWVMGRGLLTDKADDGSPLRVVGVGMDVTERRQQETQLRLLSTAVEQSPVSIVIANLKAEIEYINDTFLRITGYAREEIIGQNPRILQSGKTPKETYTDLWTTLTAGRRWDGEFWNKRKDGTEYVESVAIVPMRNSHGDVTHYVGIKEDITKQKEIAVELDQHRHRLEDLVGERTNTLALRERHLNTILHGIPGVVGYWDANQINRFANAAYQDWLGIGPEEIEGKHLREIFGDEIYEANRSMIEGALAGQPQ